MELALEVRPHNSQFVQKMRPVSAIVPHWRQLVSTLFWAASSIKQTSYAPRRCRNQACLLKKSYPRNPPKKNHARTPCFRLSQIRTECANERPSGSVRRQPVRVVPAGTSLTPRGNFKCKKPARQIKHKNFLGCSRLLLRCLSNRSRDHIRKRSPPHPIRHRCKVHYSIFCHFPPHRCRGRGRRCFAQALS
jgi:hypothetical protein